MNRTRMTVSGRPRQRLIKPTKKAVSINVCDYCGKKRRFNPSQKHGFKCTRCRAHHKKQPVMWRCKCGGINPIEMSTCSKCNLPQEV